MKKNVGVEIVELAERKDSIWSRRSGGSGGATRSRHWSLEMKFVVLTVTKSTLTHFCDKCIIYGYVF